MIRAARYKPTVWTTADFPDLERAKIGLKGSPTIVAKTWVPEIKAVKTQMITFDSPETGAAQLADQATDEGHADPVGLGLIDRNGG